MMTTTRIPTLDRMIHLNRALDQALSGTYSGRNNSQVWIPAIDLVEKTDGYLIIADLPGVIPDQVDIRFDHNTLSIRGSKPSTMETLRPDVDSEESEPQEQNGSERKSSAVRLFAAERLGGSFERAVRLPDHVDSEHIEASFENGVLTLWAPKTPQAQPRRITVGGGKKVNG